VRCGGRKPAKRYEVQRYLPSKNRSERILETAILKACGHERKGWVNEVSDWEITSKGKKKKKKTKGPGGRKMGVYPV